METLDLGLDFKGTHVLITGGAGYIGSAVVSAFLQLGASVSVLDLSPQKLNIEHERLQIFQTDTSSEAAVADAFEKASAASGVPTVCIALAALDLSVLPHHDSLTEMPLEQWRRTFQVNVEGTFLTARAWLRGIKAHAGHELRNVSLIIVGSESGTFGERGNADYASSKSAVQFGMVQSLMADAARVYPGARYVSLSLKLSRSQSYVVVVFSILEVELIVTFIHRFTTQCILPILVGTDNLTHLARVLSIGWNGGDDCSHAKESQSQRCSPRSGRHRPISS